MIGARRCDDAIPDDSLVGSGIGRNCLARGSRGGPLGRDVDEQLFSVPCEERREVRVERELDDGVFLLFAAVVVGAPAHDLEVGRFETVYDGRAGRNEVGEGDEGCDDEGDGGEEAEGVLYSD